MAYRYAALLLLPPFLGGCGAGVAALVLGVLSSDGDGDDGTVVLPPAVKELRISSPASSEIVLVEFGLSSRQGGRLGAKIKFIPFARVEGAGPVQKAQPAPATAALGSALLEDLPADTMVRFIWDAGRDLPRDSSLAQIVVTPSADEVEGEPVVSTLFHAGRNTPVEVDDLLISSEGDLIVANFNLVDEESDPITLEEVEVAIGGGAHAALPPDVLQGVLRSFPSAPGRGAPGSIIFNLRDLDRPEMPEEVRLVSRPGFVGEIALRISVRDFPVESMTRGTGRFIFDNNDPPFVEILPNDREDLSGGVIPIRFRLFDKERNPADLQLEVDLGDGLGFRAAYEFPREPSRGRTGFSTLDPSSFGDPTRPLYTFLWDALSQVQGPRRVTLAVRARDRETGSPSLHPLGELSLGGMESREFRVGEVPGDLTTGDFDQDGFADLAVASSGSDTVTIFLGDRAGLEHSLEFGTGRYPVDLEAGDFNGDSLLDLAVSNMESNSITVLFTDSESFWGDLVDIGVGLFPQSLVGGDFDGDGFIDLLVANTGSDDLTLLKGARAGLMESGQIAMGDTPNALASGDFDADGFRDLAVTLGNSRSLSYLRGGRSGLEKAGEIPVGDAPIALTRSDYDGDGFEDLAVLNQNSNNLSFLRGGEGGLQRVGEISTGKFPAALTSGDLDGDGFPEVVVGNSESNDLTLLRGGTAGLARVGEILALDQPSELAPADFNRDGYLDLLVSNWSSGTATLIQGSPGGLLVVEKFKSGPFTDRIVTEDFNGDTFPDAAVTSNSGAVTVLEGGRIGPRWKGEFKVRFNPQALASGNFDGDAFLDVAVVNFGSEAEFGSLTVLRGGAEGLERVGDLIAGDGSEALAAGDFDGDQFSDVLVTNYYSRNLHHFRGGPGGIRKVEEIAAGKGPSALVVGDFRGTGFLEAVAANTLSNDLTYLRCGATTGFERVGEVPAGMLPVSLLTGDFDGDGFTDLVAANRDSGNVTYLRGGRDGLSRVGETPAGETPQSLIEGDFDGDGYLELVVANGGSGSLTVLEGATGGMMPVAEIPPGDGADQLASADFDADGFADLATGNSESASLTWFRGGPGGLTRAAEVYLGDFPTTLISADADGDAFPDVLVGKDSGGLIHLHGGAGGLDRPQELATGNFPTAALAGDFNSDGLPDLVSLDNRAGAAAYLQGRYLMVHPNFLLEQESEDVGPLLDPRSPPRYRLDLPAGALGPSSQACLIPGAVFGLPQGEASRRGKYYLVVTDPVSILRETEALELPGRLTLRIREENQALLEEVLDHPDRLRVFRKDLQTGKGNEVNPGPGTIEIVEFANGKGVAFPILLFGTYLAAFEKDR